LLVDLSETGPVDG